MKHFLIQSAFTFLLLSCTSSEKKTNAQVDSIVSIPSKKETTSSSVVKKDSVANDTTLSISIPLINGSVYYSLPYCGGARPPEDVLSDLAEWKTLSDATLILKNKSGKYEIILSADGKFSGRFPEGTYAVYLKKVKKDIWDISPAGCENCLAEPITTATLSVNGKNKIHFTFRCDSGARLRP